MLHNFRAQLARMSDEQLLAMGQSYAETHSAVRHFHHLAHGHPNRRAILLRALNRTMRCGLRSTKRQMRERILVMQPADAVRIRRL